ncbi:MAG: prepilin-type N-terminal cleavage/methylation domain-containing protein [Oscillibacter sp.]|nr:prepilin-type N-terminal cleavage/methylation domain-containing protein [Oscillibacter sp.]
MKQLMKKGTAGSTLVEVVVAIAILGLVTAPICSSMLVAARINARSRDVMTAQLQLSSAVEQLMAEGIDEGKGIGDKISSPGVEVTVEGVDGSGKYYEITVTSELLDTVSVKTCVKSKRRFGGQSFGRSDLPENLGGGL